MDMIRRIIIRWRWVGSRNRLIRTNGHPHLLPQPRSSWSMRSNSHHHRNTKESMVWLTNPTCRSMGNQSSRAAHPPIGQRGLSIEAMETVGLQPERTLTTVRVTQNNSNIINSRLTNTKEITQMQYRLFKCNNNLSLRESKTGRTTVQVVS